MFLGKEAYTAKIQEPLLQAKIFKNKENVNQAVERLKNHGNFLLKFLREENWQGRPKIHTANMNPIFVTLREAKITFDEEIIESLFKSLSCLNDDFPSYLVKTLTYGGQMRFSTKSLTWTRTLGFYFLFLSTTLIKESPQSQQVPTNTRIRRTIMFRALSSSFVPSIKEPSHLKKLKEVLNNRPYIALDFMDIALLLLVLSSDDSAKSMMVPHKITLEGTSKSETEKESIQNRFCIDTSVQLNRLILWIFIPDYLSRSEIPNKVNKYLEKMLDTQKELDKNERSQLISDCWGSIATFWWCRELQPNGKCDVSTKICPVWPDPKTYLFQPKISPMTCKYIKESVQDFLKGNQYFDYARRVNEGRSTSWLELMLTRK